MTDRIETEEKKQKATFAIGSTKQAKSKLQKG